MLESCLNELFNILPKDKILLNEPMSKHTSIKIGGPADAFVKLDSLDDIKKIVEFVKKYNIPFYIIGNGSNLLVNDDGVNGIVLKIEMNKITVNKIDNYAEVIVESGASIGALAYKLLQNSITGFEELSGIPGTIGGAIRMNAGAHGKEMKDVVYSTTYMDMNGNIKIIKNEEHGFEYRKSMFSKNNYIILETMLKLKLGDTAKIKADMEMYSKVRREKQPLDYPNAGSTFKRGDGFITASLIDECGLKGYAHGGAQVSTKHAGFIINTGNATAKDVLDLAEHVKKVVYNKTGKKIELEIQVI